MELLAEMVYGERRTEKRERERVAVMCNGELYRRRRACEAKRDLNWKWSDVWVSPHMFTFMYIT